MTEKPSSGDRALHRLLFPKGCLLKDCPYEQPTPDEWVAACISACYATGVGAE